MSTKLLVAAGALLLSTSAMAQAGPVAEKSSEEIVCQLTGDCAAVDPSLATEDRPEDRGFSIAKRGAPSGAAATTPQRAQPARATAARPAASSGGASTQRFSIARPVTGKADLSINFVSGSATLTDSGRNQADAFYRALAAPSLAAKRFAIAGHTDASGSRALNINLSRRRAQAVVDYLVLKGADRSKFDVKGYGFDRPIKGTSPRSSVNRRVEVVKLD